jgi:hypothetical protein
VSEIEMTRDGHYAEAPWGREARLREKQRRQSDDHDVRRCTSPHRSYTLVRAEVARSTERSTEEPAIESAAAFSMQEVVEAPGIETYNILAKLLGYSLFPGFHSS